MGPEFPDGHGKKENTIVNTSYYQTRGSVVTCHYVYVGSYGEVGDQEIPATKS